VRPTAKVTMDNLQKSYEESIGTKMNDLDLCLEVVQGHTNHFTFFTIFGIEYIGNRNRGLVPKDHQ